MFINRLQYLMDLKKINQSGLAAAIGINHARVSDWLRGSVKKPQRDTVRKIAVFFGCDVEWLATGKGDPWPAKTETGSNNVTLMGDGSIMAGRSISGGIAISGEGRGGRPRLILEEDEEELILLLREVGGKMALRKFVAELQKIKSLLDQHL